MAYTVDINSMIDPGSSPELSRALREGLEAAQKNSVDSSGIAEEIARRDQKIASLKSALKSVYNACDDRFNECVNDMKDRIAVYRGAAEEVSDDMIQSMKDPTELRDLCDCLKSYVMEICNIVDCAVEDAKAKPRMFWINDD